MRRGQLSENIPTDAALLSGAKKTSCGLPDLVLILAECRPGCPTGQSEVREAVTRSPSFLTS
ncbi:hypothetical protein D3C76_666590 [compost metagenome]